MFFFSEYGRGDHEYSYRVRKRPEFDEDWTLAHDEPKRKAKRIPPKIFKQAPVPITSQLRFSAVHRPFTPNIPKSKAMTVQSSSLIGRSGVSKVVHAAVTKGNIPPITLGDGSVQIRPVSVPGQHPRPVVRTSTSNKVGGRIPQTQVRPSVSIVPKNGSVPPGRAIRLALLTQPMPQNPGKNPLATLSKNMKNNALSVSLQRLDSQGRKIEHVLPETAVRAVATRPFIVRNGVQTIRTNGPRPQGGAVFRGNQAVIFRQQAPKNVVRQVLLQAPPRAVNSPGNVRATLSAGGPHNKIIIRQSAPVLLPTTRPVQAKPLQSAPAALAHMLSRPSAAPRSRLKKQDDSPSNEQLPVVKTASPVTVPSTQSIVTAHPQPQANKNGPAASLCAPNGDANSSQEAVPSSSSSSNSDMPFPGLVTVNSTKSSYQVAIPSDHNNALIQQTPVPLPSSTLSLPPPVTVPSTSFQNFTPFTDGPLNTLDNCSINQILSPSTNNLTSANSVIMQGTPQYGDCLNQSQLPPMSSLTGSYSMDNSYSSYEPAYAFTASTAVSSCQPSVPLASQVPNNILAAQSQQLPLSVYSPTGSLQAGSHDQYQHAALGKNDGSSMPDIICSQQIQEGMNDIFIFYLF